MMPLQYTRTFRTLTLPVLRVSTIEVNERVVAHDAMLKCRMNAEFSDLTP
jgi:hypothetical protein